MRAPKPILFSLLALTTLFIRPPNPIHAEEKADRPKIEWGIVLWDLDFSANSSRFATVGDSLRVYDTKTGELVWQPRRPRGMRCAAFSPTEPDLLVANVTDGRVVFCDVAKKSMSGRRTQDSGDVSDVAFSPDGRWLATVDSKVKEGKITDGYCRLWDVKNRKIVHTFKSLEYGSFCVDFSADGQFLVIGLISPDRDIPSALEVYAVESRMLSQRILIPGGFPMSVAFVAETKQLIVSGGDCVPGIDGCDIQGKLWFADATSDRDAKLIHLEKKYFYFPSCCVAPTGVSFATGTSSRAAGDPHDNTEIQMRSTEDGSVLWSTRKGVGRPYGTRVSPDGQLVAYCIDHSIYLLDAGNGDIVRSIDVKK